MIASILLASLLCQLSATYGLEDRSSPSLGFVESQGGDYQSQIGGVLASFDSKGWDIWMTSIDEDAVDSVEEPWLQKNRSRQLSRAARSHRIRISMENSSPDVHLHGLGEREGRVFIAVGRTLGSPRPHYDAVLYRGIRPGIDLKIYETRGHMEYDVIASPGASLDDVIFRCEGAHSMRIEEDGSLVMTSPLGELRQTVPVAEVVTPSGQRRSVECRFVLLDQERFAFIAEGRDESEELIIDPGLIYGTFLGGSGCDVGNAIAVDDLGFVYVVGETFSINFPTSGHLVGRQSVPTHKFFRPHSDAFLTKMSPSGGIVYSVQMGGSDDDRFYDVKVDAQGAVTVCGSTSSYDFPISRNAYQPYLAGETDALAARISPDGSAIEFSTYIGGESYEEAFAVEIGPDGDAYITGDTDSPEFPTTGSAYDRSYSGDGDIFVTRIQSDGIDLSYSTFVGGNAEETGLDIVHAGGGEVFVTGRTEENFPTTSNAFDRNPSGGWETIFFKLSASGSQLLYSSYFDGPQMRDHGHAIEIDNDGDVYLAGVTASDSHPTTPGAADRFNTLTVYDAYVAKLRIHSGFTELIYSTYVGRDEHDVPWAMALDPIDESVIIAGLTYSPELPIAGCALSTELEGLVDAFIVRVTPDGSDYSFASYLSGETWEEARGIAIAPDASVYVTGVTYSRNFETTPDARQRYFNGRGDAFVVRIGSGSLGQIADLDFEVDDGWSVENSNLETGAWERGVPIDGNRGDPDQDYDGSGQCWVSGNLADEDVDGGPTRLLSPSYDLSELVSADISYARWINSDDNDTLTVEYSWDGGAQWAQLESVTGTGGWSVQTFTIEDPTRLTNQFRLRFSVADQPNDSVTEAALDRLRIVGQICPK